jgi:hypothetical protein
MAKQIMIFVENADTTLKFLNTGNLFLTWLLAGSLQTLYGLIRIMQKIVMISIIEVPIPVHTTIFYQACFDLQKLDMFKGEEILAILLSLKETPPLSFNFE